MSGTGYWSTSASVGIKKDRDYPVFYSIFEQVYPHYAAASPEHEPSAGADMSEPPAEAAGASDAASAAGADISEPPAGAAGAAGAASPEHDPPWHEPSPSK